MIHVHDVPCVCDPSPVYIYPSRGGSCVKQFPTQFPTRLLYSREGRLRLHNDVAGVRAHRRLPPWSISFPLVVRQGTPKPLQQAGRWKEVSPTLLAYLRYGHLLPPVVRVVEGPVPAQGVAVAPHAPPTRRVAVRRSCELHPAQLTLQSHLIPIQIHPRPPFYLT